MTIESNIHTYAIQELLRRVEALEASVQYLTKQNANVCVFCNQPQSNLFNFEHLVEGGIICATCANNKDVPVIVCERCNRYTQLSLAVSECQCHLPGYLCQSCAKRS
jgi:hypothetical protein